MKLFLLIPFVILLAQEPVKAPAPEINPPATQQVPSQLDKDEMAQWQILQLQIENLRLRHCISANIPADECGSWSPQGPYIMRIIKTKVEDKKK